MHNKSKTLIKQPIKIQEQFHNLNSILLALFNANNIITRNIY